MTDWIRRSLVTSLLLLAGCSSTDATKNTAPLADDGGANVDFTKFDSAVESFLTSNNLKGASGVVVHKDHGIVHTKGYGAYPADRKYLVASSSKIVSVGVLMRLADQGKVD